MKLQVSRLQLEFYFEPKSPYLSVSYHGLDDEGNAPGIVGSLSSLSLPRPGPGWGKLVARLPALMNALEAASGAEPVEVEIDGSVVQVHPRLVRMHWSKDVITLTLTWPGTSKSSPVSLRVDELTTAHRRFLDSVVATLDRMAWEDLRKNVGAASQRDRVQVFISYRSGHERFAEALAQRLGHEGFIPWFDKWDIRAGDSVPGKIEQAFHESEAFLPVITTDYQEGKWATDELMTAITKRLEEGYRIVPILLESCEKPELIKHLRHVDFSAQDPETYEAKVAELIDGIYGMELNPFR